MLRLMIPELTIKQIAKFWERVDTTPGQGPFGTCWEWKALRHKSKYGHVGFGDKMFWAHRVAHKLYYQSDPPELSICHRCDNEPCCHPFHLFAGTHQENMTDMALKGRAPHMRGSINGYSKLTESDVLSIRKQYADGATQQELAVRYGRLRQTIWLIVHRKQWTHI